jgi:hypothetical protein
MVISPSTKRRLPSLFAVLATASIGFALYGPAGDEKRWQLAFTLVGASAVLVHFLYVRHLEETKMFRELFIEFNARYDKLNEKLNKLVKRDGLSQLELEDEHLLFDYFNLCGEEFFFYRSGYIPSEVWDAWRRGIQGFIKVDCVRELLRKELDGNSYYGLTLEEIERP